jgi:hypothetical protein
MIFGVFFQRSSYSFQLIPSLMSRTGLLPLYDSATPIPKRAMLTLLYSEDFCFSQQSVR